MSAGWGFIGAFIEAGAHSPIEPSPEPGLILSTQDAPAQARRIGNMRAIDIVRIRRLEAVSVRGGVPKAGVNREVDTQAVSSRAMWSASQRIAAAGAPTLRRARRPGATRGHRR